MLKKLALCFCLIACALALCACGAEPEKYEFKAGVNYNEDLEARKKLLEEIVKLYDEQINYGGADMVGIFESQYAESGFEVSYFEIHSAETAEILFCCVRNAKTVQDLTGIPLMPEPLPVRLSNEVPIGSFDHVYIEFPPTEQFFGIYFTEEDTKTFHEHALAQGLAFLPEEILENGGMKDAVINELLKNLKEQMVYGESDELSMCYEIEKRYIECADICTEESAELLFTCVENCLGIRNISGAELGEEHMPLVINGKPIGNFNYLYLDYPPTESRVAIELDWQYADALYEHLFAQGSDELHRDKWGNIMPPTKTGERIVP